MKLWSSRTAESRYDAIILGVKVLLRNPRREVDVQGPKRVQALLAELGVNRESVLVIRGDTLVTHDVLLEDADVVEVRPVTSGG